MTASGRRGALLISAGVIAGQVATVLIVPVLTRHYTPQEFGYFTVFNSILGIFANTASIQYELAIPLPKSNRSAALITCAAIAIVILSAIIFALALGFCGHALLGWAKSEQVYDARYWLPTVFVMSGLGTVLTLNSIRYGTHARNGVARALQGGSQSAFQLVAALLGASWVGLVWGQFLGLVAGAIPLWDSRWPRLLRGSWATNWARTIALLKRYRNFPLAATPSTLINSAGSNLPSLLLTALFEPRVAGLYGLGFRILQIPLRLFGQAVSQVFLGQAAGAAWKNALPQTTARIYRVLLTFSLHTFIPIACVAQQAIKLAFGDTWAEAGLYIQWLSPWLMLTFIVTPLGMLVAVCGRQRQELILQVVYLVAMAVGLGAGALTRRPVVALAAMSLSASAFLLWKLWWLAGISACDRPSLARLTLRETLLAMLIYLPLPMLYLLGTAPTVICAIALVFSACAHLYNYKVRGAYAF